MRSDLNDPDKILNMKFEDYFEPLHIEEAPFIFNILSHIGRVKYISLSDCDINFAPIDLALCNLLKIGSKRISAIPLINTLIMITESTKKSVINRLQPSGVTVSMTSSENSIFILQFFGTTSKIENEKSSGGLD